MSEPAPKRRSKDPWPPVRPGIAAWWRDHMRISRETAHFVSARLGTSLLVWLLVGIALALPAGLFLLQQNLAEMTEAWDGRPGITAYFSLDADDAMVAAAADVLAAEIGIEAVEITDRDAALAEFRSFTELANALELLDSNPLPASLRATLVGDVDLEELEALTIRVQDLAGVAEVVVEKTWLERVSAISNVVTRLGVILGLLFGIGAILVTSTSVRLAIEARLEELRGLRLIGATERQMRRPFLSFGAFYGLGGGLVAAMLISLCLVVVETPLSNLLGSYAQQLDLVGFDPLFLGSLLLLGGALGVVGAQVAASQRLKDLEIL